MPEAALGSRALHNDYLGVQLRGDVAAIIPLDIPVQRLKTPRYWRGPCGEPARVPAGSDLPKPRPTLGHHARNDVLFASVLTSDSTRTVAIGLEEYVISNGSGSGAVLWNELMAAALISAVPAVVFFFAAQRLVVNGLTAGAVRG